MVPATAPERRAVVNGEIAGEEDIWGEDIVELGL